MAHDLLEKPATHAAWSPFFDEQGNFVRSVEIGYGIVETDAKGRVAAQTFKDRQVTGYDSGYVCLIPIGEQPPAPPPEIIEAARFEAEQRKNLALGVAV
jgi:hypothetical protein